MIESGLAMELAIRVLTTAAIVIAVALAVEKLGPSTGGVLGGLPIVIGPGFFFLLGEHGPAFAGRAAASALIALSASQVFLLVYIVLARRSRAALFAAGLGWVAAAALVALLPPSPWLGLGLFVGVTAGVRRIGGRFERRGKAPPPVKGRRTLLLRGLLAGALVALATLLARTLGPTWAGLLLTYPVGLTVIAMTLHQRNGADVTVTTLRASMLGISSLAAFAFTLAVALNAVGERAGFALALAASAGVTALLTCMAQSRRDAGR